MLYVCCCFVSFDLLPDIGCNQDDRDEMYSVMHTWRRKDASASEAHQAVHDLILVLFISSHLVSTRPEPICRSNCRSTDVATLYRIHRYGRHQGHQKQRVHTVRRREIGPDISETSKRVPIFPMLPWEASKCVPIFDRGTGSKPTRLGQPQIQFPAV